MNGVSNLEFKLLKTYLNRIDIQNSLISALNIRKINYDTFLLSGKLREIKPFEITLSECNIIVNIYDEKVIILSAVSKTGNSKIANDVSYIKSKNTRFDKFSKEDLEIVHTNYGFEEQLFDKTFYRGKERFKVNKNTNLTKPFDIVKLRERHSICPKNPVEAYLIDSSIIDLLKNADDLFDNLNCQKLGKSDIQKIKRLNN